MKNMMIEIGDVKHPKIRIQYEGVTIEDSYKECTWSGKVKLHESIFKLYSYLMLLITVHLVLLYFGSVITWKVEITDECNEYK